jgi:hypothetical protein
MEQYNMSQRQITGKHWGKHILIEKRKQTNNEVMINVNKGNILPIQTKIKFDLQYFCNEEGNKFVGEDYICQKF